MKKPSLQLSQVLGHHATDKRIDILRRVGMAGSISEAARGAGVSYKAAWQALETLANLAGAPLLEKAVGGSGGGGALLTPAGERVLQAAEVLARARQQALEQLVAAQGPAAVGAGPGRAAQALRTSMRNQFPCTVGALEPQHGQVRVQLLLPGGDAIHSRITRESAQLLGLAPDLPVLGLCKATAVRVAASVATSPSCNVLQGVVTRASRAKAGGEASLRLSSGVQLVGFASAGHGLRPGKAAMAAVEEVGVVIAAAD